MENYIASGLRKFLRPFVELFLLWKVKNSPTLAEMKRQEIGEALLTRAPNKNGAFEFDRMVSAVKLVFMSALCINILLVLGIAYISWQVSLLETSILTPTVLGICSIATILLIWVFISGMLELHMNKDEIKYIVDITTRLDAFCQAFNVFAVTSRPRASSERASWDHAWLRKRTSIDWAASEYVIKLAQAIKYWGEKTNYQHAVEPAKQRLDAMMKSALELGVVISDLANQAAISAQFTEKKPLPAETASATSVE